MNYMQFIYSFPYLASQIPDYFAAIFPEKTALVFNQKSYTYAGLQKQISTFASSLRRRGIQKGSKFLILLPNVPQFLFSLFGIMSTGLIAVPVYYHSKAAEIRKIMDIIHADGIVTTESKFETLKKNVPHFHPKLNILYRDEMEEDLPINFLGEEPLWDENPCLPIDLDPALIIFTSGSTGKPKGILLSHRNLVANTLANVQALQFHDRDRTLVQLPLTYLYALVHQVFSTFLTGGTIYLTDQFFLPFLFLLHSFYRIHLCIIVLKRVKVIDVSVRTLSDFSVDLNPRSQLLALGFTSMRVIKSSQAQLENILVRLFPL